MIWEDMINRRSNHQIPNQKIQRQFKLKCIIISLESVMWFLSS